MSETPEKTQKEYGNPEKYFKEVWDKIGRPSSAFQELIRKDLNRLKKLIETFPEDTRGPLASLIPKAFKKGALLNLRFLIKEERGTPDELIEKEVNIIDKLFKKLDQPFLDYSLSLLTEILGGINKSPDKKKRDTIKKTVLTEMERLIGNTNINPLMVLEYFRGPFIRIPPDETEIYEFLTNFKNIKQNPETLKKLEKVLEIFNEIFQEIAEISNFDDTTGEASIWYNWKIRSIENVVLILHKLDPKLQVLSGRIVWGLLHIFKDADSGVFPVEGSMKYYDPIVSMIKRLKESLDKNNRGWAGEGKEEPLIRAYILGAQTDEKGDEKGIKKFLREIIRSNPQVKRYLNKDNEEIRAKLSAIFFLAGYSSKGHSDEEIKANIEKFLHFMKKNENGGYKIKSFKDVIDRIIINNKFTNEDDLTRKVLEEIADMIKWSTLPTSQNLPPSTTTEGGTTEQYT